MAVTAILIFGTMHLLQARWRRSGKGHCLVVPERANFALLQSRNYATNQHQILND